MRRRGVCEIAGPADILTGHDGQRQTVRIRPDEQSVRKRTEQTRSVVFRTITLTWKPRSDATGEKTRRSAGDSDHLGADAAYRGDLYVLHLRAVAKEEAEAKQRALAAAALARSRCQGSSKAVPPPAPTTAPTTAPAATPPRLRPRTKARHRNQPNQPEAKPAEAKPATKAEKPARPAKKPTTARPRACRACRFYPKVSLAPTENWLGSRAARRTSASAVARGSARSEQPRNPRDPIADFEALLGQRWMHVHLDAQQTGWAVQKRHQIDLKFDAPELAIKDIFDGAVKTISSSAASRSELRAGSDPKPLPTALCFRRFI